MLNYVVVETSDNNTYVYDSRKQKSTYYAEYTKGKRQLLTDYLQSEFIEDVISVQEYVLPDSRQQIICWYRKASEKKTTQEISNRGSKNNPCSLG